MNMWKTKLEYSTIYQFSSVQSLSRVWFFVTPGLQHTRLPCPSLFPGVCSNSCLSSHLQSPSWSNHTPSPPHASTTHPNTTASTCVPSWRSQHGRVLGMTSRDHLQKADPHLWANLTPQSWAVVPPMENKRLSALACCRMERRYPSLKHSAASLKHSSLEQM